VEKKKEEMKSGAVDRFRGYKETGQTAVQWFKFCGGFTYCVICIVVIILIPILVAFSKLGILGL